MPGGGVAAASGSLDRATARDLGITPGSADHIRAISNLRSDTPRKQKREKAAGHQSGATTNTTAAVVTSAVPGLSDPAPATPQPTQRSPQARSLDAVLADVDALIGLPAWKKALHREVVAVQAEQLKREADPTYESRRLRRHTISAGPPGTGKTTAARLQSEAYTALGISNGHFSSTAAGDLLGMYIGEGRNKTRAWLESIASGDGFIDEFGAITEAKGTDADLGQEVVATLVDWMENRPECPNLNIADYSQRIDAALRMNDGLASRFRRRFIFEPYSVSELVEIALLEAAADRHGFTPEAETELKNALTYLYARFSEHSSWSNGRVSRKLYEESKDAQENHLAERVAADPTGDRRRIIAGDVREGLEAFLEGNSFPEPVVEKSAAEMLAETFLAKAPSPDDFVAGDVVESVPAIDVGGR